MTSQQFIIWLKGFTEACEGLTASPKQWEKIIEVLNNVEDYNDYGDIDEEAEEWYNNPNTFREPQNPHYIPNPPYMPPYRVGDSPDWMQYPQTISGTTNLTGSASSISVTVTSGSGTTSTGAVWNDKMGCWHYTNYPEGFGYYFNSQDKKKKND